MKKKFLFALDLDGTLLKNSQTGEIHPDNKIAIDRAIAEGHVVCIITGRPWRASQESYEALGLNTMIANYNGAHIHNPSDYSFIPNVSYLNLHDVMYILGDKKLKAASVNKVIEGPGWCQLEKRSPALERVFNFKNEGKTKIGINVEKLSLKPTGVIIDTKKGLDIIKLLDYLKRRYGDIAEFSSWSKGDGLTPVFDITAPGAKKSSAISLMTRFYDIDSDNVIAIGDGLNDIPMFKIAGVSVAMKNARDGVKKRAVVVTEYSNKEGGVAHYINKFLDNPDEEHSKALKIRETKFQTSDIEYNNSNNVTK